MRDNRRPRSNRWAAEAAADLGPWLLYVAGVASMFLVASLLRDRLGEFWSHAAFLPIWGITYGATHWLSSIRGKKP